MSELILTHEELSNRLEIKEGEFRIDSRLVVDGFGLPNHTSYRNNILDKYEAKFKQLGVILKITLDNGEIVWYLNQAQFNFAGTLARNTEKAIDFKLNLVKAFEVATKKQVSQQYPNQIAGDISINPILDFASNLKGLIGVIYPTAKAKATTRSSPPVTHRHRQDPRRSSKIVLVSNDRVLPSTSCSSRKISR
jgi:hypothetical protein